MGLRAPPLRCRDPLIALLADYGYCAVRLPRADFVPLSLLERHDRRTLRLYGSLEHHLPAASGTTKPRVAHGRRVGNLSGQRSGQLGADVGLELLGTIIGAMGGSPFGVRAAYERSHALTFEFAEVVEDSAELGDLDLYLGSVSEPAGTRARDLVSEGKLYVALAVLKASQVMVEARGASGGAIELSVPEIQGVLGASVKVSPRADRGSTVAYKGSQPLVFAFKAIQVFQQDGTYTTRDWATQELKALPDAEAPRRHLVVDDELIEFAS